MVWIKAKLARQTATENNGVVQQMTQVAEGKSYTFGLTADSGFFKVVIIPAPELTDEQQPLTLVFSFRDLYLVGFLHGDIWYVFDDARLIGSGHNEHPEAYRLLGFKGAYVNIHFSTVEVSNWDLHQSYDSLVHYPGRSKNEVMVALYRLIVVVSEACRFPEWMSHVQSLLENMMTETADHERHFSRMFKDWSTISKRARRGVARFVVAEGDMFPSFESLLQNIGVALSRPPGNQL